LNSCSRPCDVLFPLAGATSLRAAATALRCAANEACDIILLRVPCECCGDQRVEVFRVLSGDRCEATAANAGDEPIHVIAVERMAQWAELVEDAARASQISGLR
jgi:hypothetical protein